MKTILGFLAFVTIVFVLITHLGPWISLADSAAVFRPLALMVATVLVIMLLLVKLRWLAVTTLLVVALSCVDLIVSLRGGGDGLGGPFSLYQKNLLWNGEEREALLSDILAADADFVTLQETSSRNTVVLDGLNKVYPYQLSCSTPGNGGIALYSKYPLTETEERCNFGDGVVVAQAKLPDEQSIWVASVHLDRPFPYGQSRQVPGVVEGIASLDGPKLIGGDFNMVSWGSPVKKIADAAGAVRLGGYFTSFPAFGWSVPLPIDHVMVPKGAGGVVTTRPLFGSDHSGLLAQFSL